MNTDSRLARDEGARFSNTEDLVDLQDAIIDESTLRQLCFDIETQARVLELRLKGSATEHAEVATGGLASLIPALLEGSISAAQIRYEFAGQLWCDTLMTTARGIRIVRTSMQT